MLKLIRDNKPFLILVLAFWILCLFMLFSLSKGELHFMLNAYHTRFLDLFFRFYTELGAWIPFVVAFALLLYNYGAALLVLIPQLLIALPLYAIKQYYSALRPLAYFPQEQFVKLQIAGVDYHGTNSFPSGHTTAAFALFFSLSVLVKNVALKVLFFVLAIGVGFSRIYLSQHFLADVFGGSIIAVLIGLMYIHMQQKYHRPWMDKSLLGLLKK